MEEVDISKQKQAVAKRNPKVRIAMMPLMGKKKIQVIYHSTIYYYLQGVKKKSLLNEMGDREQQITHFLLHGGMSINASLWCYREGDYIR